MIGGFIEVHDRLTGMPRMIGIDHIVAIRPGFIIKRDDLGTVIGKEESESVTDIYTDSSWQYSDVYCIRVREDYQKVHQLISEGVHKVFDDYRKRVG